MRIIKWWMYTHCYILIVMLLLLRVMCVSKWSSHWAPEMLIFSGWSTAPLQNKSHSCTEGSAATRLLNVRLFVMAQWARGTFIVEMASNQAIAPSLYIPTAWSLALPSMYNDVFLAAWPLHLEPLDVENASVVVFTFIKSTAITRKLICLISMGTHTLTMWPWGKFMRGLQNKWLCPEI